MIYFCILYNAIIKLFVPYVCESCYTNKMYLHLFKLNLALNLKRLLVPSNPSPFFQTCLKPAYIYQINAIFFSTLNAMLCFVAGGGDQPGGL